MAFVLFDLGGVLVDVEVQRAKDAWVKAGHDVKHFDAAFYESGAKAMGDLGHLDQEGMRARVEQSASGQVSHDALVSIWGAGVSWRPWVSVVLSRLRVPYGVLSTIDPIHALALGPLPGANPIVYSCDIGAVKPDPRAFDIAASRCPVPAAQVRYVDDLADNVIAARAAGFWAYQVRDQQTLLRALADVLSDQG